jgi:hypothetical protein
MLLPDVLFILFLAGCWLLCLTDVATTPAAEFPGLSKRGWIALIAVTFTAGAIAWYVTRTRRRLRCWPRTLASHVSMGGYYYDAGLHQGRPMTAAEAALARHPASQARRAEGPVRPVPIGPDDDPEFLRMLDRLIGGSSDASELPRCLRFPHEGLPTAHLAGQTEESGARGQLS